jgi:hypothetical protein
MSGFDWKSSFSWISASPSHKGLTWVKKKNFSLQPRVEALEDRLVPAVVDLTTVGASVVVNRAIFQQALPQPTGCGVIHDFVRIQSHGSAVQQGYNTDARPLQFDEKSSPVFTRSLALSDVPQTTLDGVNYRVFLLGVNQSSSQPLISLDELRLYVSSSPNLTGYDPSTNQLDGQAPVYDLGVSNWVKLDASLSHGNGSGDVFLYVPDSLLSSGGPYVYLYSKFGVNIGCNGGFEQWATKTVVGLPFNESSLSGSVSALGGGALSGVLVTLTGTNVLGQAVSITVTTDTNGNYIFSNLLSGSYTITEAPPPDYTFFSDSIGTQGGTAGIDLLVISFLPAGVNGTNNNFVDQLTVQS